MLLAQNGANVIKIEPKEGDWSRTLGDQYGDHSAFSVAANLGKKSIVIDLKNKESKSIVDKIISKADIFYRAEEYHQQYIQKRALSE